MNILISAGDLSGEIYGAEILRGLKQIFPTANFFSLTKGILSEAGAVPISRVSGAGVVGITEVFDQFKNLCRLIQSLRRFFKHFSPQAVILIDFPDMNLHIIARMAKQRGAKTLYFIPPQVWAWRRSRIRLLKKLIDALIVILPFEEVFYKKEGINNVVYFGHPLVDKISSEHRHLPGIEDNPIIGIFPGSRISEWNHHIPIINRVVRGLTGIYPQANFLLAVAPGIEKIASSFHLIPNITPIYGTALESSAKRVFSKCHLALVASGTVTLEAALFEIPMVVFYRVSTLSALIGRKLIKTPFISLPNIISGKRIVPEHIQYFDPEDIVESVKALLDDLYTTRGNQAYETQRIALKKVKETLGNPPVIKRIVNFIASFIETTIHLKEDKKT